MTLAFEATVTCRMEATPSRRGALALKDLVLREAVRREVLPGSA